jgi:L-fuconolactonase
MRLIDVQVHAYERNHPGRQWAGHLHGPQSANGEEMVAAMDAVGVDAAIIVSTFNLYRYDPSYALEVYRKYPDRFRVVKPIDVTDPAIDDVCADWAKTEGAVGVWIMLRDELVSDPADARLNRAFAAAGRHRLPVNFLCWGRLDDGAELIRRNADTVVVIDHLGLLQPNQPPALAEPWADLPKLLALATYPNVRVKISGACTLSRKSFPYDDIWKPVLRIIDTFGIDRCMWGTDWTRTSGMLTYEQGVRPFRETTCLSDGDKAKLMAGSLENIYSW